MILFCKGAEISQLNLPSQFRFQLFMYGGHKFKSTITTLHQSHAVSCQNGLLSSCSPTQRNGVFHSDSKLLVTIQQQSSALRVVDMSIYYSSTIMNLCPYSCSFPTKCILFCRVVPGFYHHQCGCEPFREQQQSGSTLQMPLLFGCAPIVTLQTQLISVFLSSPAWSSFSCIQWLSLHPSGTMFIST